MFIHELADNDDVLGINSKFGYSEHIKLAKKIINYDSILTKKYINGLNITYHTELPNIKSIYLKEDLVNNNSELDFKQTRSDSTSSETSYTSHNSSTSIDNSDIRNFSNNNPIFKLYKKSRFFSSNDNEIEIENDNNNNELDIFNTIIINLLLRYPFFNKFNDYIPLNKMELEYCVNLSKKIGGNVYLNNITNFKI